MLEAGGDYSFSLTGADSGGGTLTDPYLYLYDSAGTLVAFDDDGLGTGFESLLDFTAPSGGSYYLGVAAYADSYSGTWTLTAEGEGGGGGADDYGSSPATAGSVGMPGSQTGALEEAGDSDWLAVQLQAGQSYRFNLDGADSGGGTLDDPYLYLYDPAETLVAQDDDDGDGLDSEILYTAAATGTHYLEARAYSDFYEGSWTMTTEIA
jgi:hypothetical protein